MKKRTAKQRLAEVRKSYKLVARTARGRDCAYARVLFKDVEGMRKYMLRPGTYGYARTRAVRAAALRAIKACERR